MELNARQLLQQAKRIAVLTGAGISAESGIPTFRGSGGLWRQFPAQDLATPQAFERDPKLVWEWYDWRRGVVAAAKPNAGHEALAEFEKNRPGVVTLITQNVDGLHDRAGSRNIIKIHGDIWTLRCLSCGGEAQNEQVPLPELPPCCSCGGMLRPGVVWFGESLAPHNWDAAQRAAMNADVLLVVGTSAAVYPAAALIPLAQSARAKVIEVNLEQTDMSWRVDISMRGLAGELLPGLLL